MIVDRMIAPAGSESNCICSVDPLTTVAQAPSISAAPTAAIHFAGIESPQNTLP
jgi:hypothetical protein